MTVAPQPLQGLRVAVIFALLLLLNVLLSGQAVPIGDIAKNANGQPAIASFVFGDSLVDAGNNNYLRFSLATAKNLPNGIDFPIPDGGTPTGRFSNGLTIPDFVALKVGAEVTKFSPPYMAPSTHGVALLNGVNYASGGGGILNNTGRIFGQRIPMDVQITYFENTLAELKELIGVDNTSDLVNNAVFSVTMGANDFLDNYLSPVPDTLYPILLPPPEFISLLISRYSFQLKRLYSLGARKFVIVNLPAIGCTPYLRSLQLGKKSGQCSQRANDLALLFNAPLGRMLKQLNGELSGAVFLQADAYSAMQDIMSNPAGYGFESVDKACCGALGSKRGIIPCRSFVKTCTDRSKYFFWDPYHPSDAGYRILADEFFDGHRYISPMNIRELVEL